MPVPSLAALVLLRSDASNAGRTAPAGIQQLP